MQALVALVDVRTWFQDPTNLHSDMLKSQGASYL